MFLFIYYRCISEIFRKCQWAETFSRLATSKVRFLQMNFKYHLFTFNSDYIYLYVVHIQAVRPSMLRFCFSEFFQFYFIFYSKFQKRRNWPPGKSGNTAELFKNISGKKNWKWSKYCERLKGEVICVETLSSCYQKDRRNFRRHTRGLKTVLMLFEKKPK